MQLKSAIFFTLFLTLVSGWHLSVNTADNWCGKRRSYYSASGKNDCYSFSDDVAAKIHSLAWCTSKTFERCTITFHSKDQCLGTILKTKNPPSVLSSGTDTFVWETDHVTNEVKARSFMVQGCLPTGVGIRDCYPKGKAPWETARWCT